MINLVELFELKRKVANELYEGLSEGARVKAREDHHSRRKPRPCGITIHTGVGCSYACAYCYIYDMGFPANVKPYPLNALEIAYALALNPYVIPKRTMAAYGSVTEPFLPETAKQAISYMAEAYKWLKLPTQVSTKTLITNELAEGICQGDPKASILVSVTTLRNRRLEPKAPDPIERIKFAGDASKAGLAVSLFIRPIIPGVTDAELGDILNIAVESGVKSIVLGSLRVTERILKNLKSLGVNVKEVEKRLTKPLKGVKQVETKMADLKGRFISMAEDLGLTVFKAACEANAHAHGAYCAMCSIGPCNINVKPNHVESSDVKDLLDYLGVKYYNVKVTENKIEVNLKDKDRSDYLETVIKLATYRRTILL
ncbi:MAG: radical SAM protein [Candidatus Bathyarchaeia archaeon]